MAELVKMDYDSHTGIAGMLFPQLLDHLKKDKYQMAKMTMNLIYSNAIKFFDKKEEIIILIKEAKQNKTNLHNIALLKRIYNLFKEDYLLLNESDEIYNLNIFQK
uniref:hypothetical protein n=1 Tax=Aliarcobacter sp. TaxID=2321116 RepID=UPI00404881EC